MQKKLLTLALFLLSAAIQLSFANNDLSIIYTYSQKAELNKILQEFGNREGIRIHTEYRSQNDLKTSVLTMMELHNAPDAMIMPADHVGLHNFINYSEIDPRIFNASIPQRIWESGKSDGKQYGIPLSQGNHLLLYYNKSLVKEPAQDWDDMLAQKLAFDAKGISTIAWPYEKPYFFLPFFSAFGGWPLNDSKVELNTPAMVAALDFYQWLRSNNLINATCNIQCSVDLFNTGKIAYTINGDWEGKNFYQTLGDKVGVSHLPLVHGKKMIPAFSTQVIAFPNNSLAGEKRATLIRLVNYLQSPQVQQALWEEMGVIPVEASTFEATHKNAKGYLKQTLALMDDTKPLQSDQAMSFIWVAIEKGFIRYWEGALNSKDATLYMQQLAERNIRNAQPHTKPKAQ